MKQLTNTLFATMAIGVACLVAGVLGATRSVAQLPITDFCAIQTRDIPYQVPPEGGAIGRVLTSGTGFYGYGRTCPLFIIDVEMTPTSHCFPLIGCLPILVFVGTYDLPSSQAFAGTTPIVQEDCQRWTTLRRFYSPAAGSGFTLSGSYDTTGTWSAGACQDSKKSDSGPPYPFKLSAPATCCVTYRFTVSTKLRTSYQEVAISFEEPPPK
jgi:hypothetical protein